MNYTTSKDYEKLWNLVQEGNEIVCWVDYEASDNEIIKDVCDARLCGKYTTIGILFSENKESFMSECNKNNVEFLPPTAWIKIESDKDLPPDGQSVECVFRGKEVSHASWDKYLNKWDNGDYYWAKEDITHWKPLPEAPKE